MEVSNGVKKRKRKPAVKVIQLSVIIFLALGLLIVYIWGVLKASDFFRIKEIIAKDGNAAQLSYLKGKNIFSVDLESESRIVSQFYPNYYKVNLVRVLPNRVYADFIKRKALALVRLNRYFAVDESGALFDLPASDAQSRLPLILGLERKIPEPKAGKRYNIKEFTLALNLIKELKKNKLLKDYEARRIDVSQISNATIFISRSPDQPGNAQGKSSQEDLEVKIGADNIKEKIIVLAGLIMNAKADIANIKYIDLRFKDPAIKLKNVK